MNSKQHPDYDPGLLSDFGGGDVNWWQDYLRAEIARANEHWQEINCNLHASPNIKNQAIKLLP